ncbi:MarR family transcriptional regulator [Pseudonocardia ailaonensis]|uniref:MarR family transcriptional regulator n=1 Tax=Pseudonocardia ailaonensis TaxID=367279 RepID=A0ABN2N8Q7_9PSEU
MLTTLTPAEEALDVAAGIRRVLRRRLRAELALPALRGAQLELLQLVEAEPGIGVAAAARSLHLAGNSVSTLVNQLVEAGLLRREPDPTDRRAVRLFLGPPAVERLTRWRTARHDLLGSALATLTDAERASVGAALPALSRLLDSLEET